MPLSFVAQFGIAFACDKLLHSESKILLAVINYASVISLVVDGDALEGESLPGVKREICGHLLIILEDSDVMSWRSGAAVEGGLLSLLNMHWVEAVPACKFHIRLCKSKDIDRSFFFFPVARVVVVANVVALVVIFTAQLYL